MAPENPYGAPMHRRRLVALAGSTVFILVFFAWTRAQWGGSFATRAFVDGASTIIPLAAGILALVRTRYLPSERKIAWRLLGLGSLSWTLGNAVWTYNELVRNQFPFPSWADVGYLGIFPFVAGALLVMIVGSTAVTSRLRTVFDGLLVGGAILFTAYALVLRPLLEYANQQESWLAKAVALAYPLGDLMMLSLLLLVASRVGPAIRRTLGILVVALIALTFADLGFWYLTALGTYQTGSVTDVGWVTCFLVLAYAAIRPIPVVSQHEAPEPGLALAVLPLIPFLIATVIAMGVQIVEGALNGFLFWNAIFVIGALVMRQFFMLLENLALRQQAEAAVRRVKESEAFRSRLLHTITHDLQNPLSPIQIQLGLLSASPLESGVLHRIAIVSRNVEQLKRLTGDLSDVSKLQDGKVNLVRQAMDLAPTLTDVAESFRPMATQRGLSLEYAPSVALPVFGDSIRLRQVLANLVSNALKFTPSGGQVTLRARLEGPNVVVEVQDTGRGLEAGEINRLFQPFSQVHKPAEAAERGTGLGLFISRGFVEGHQGTLTVHSEGLGKGSTFCLTLPPASGG